MTILEIRDNLANDQIDYSDAFEQIKKFPKPWHSKSFAIFLNKLRLLQWRMNSPISNLISSANKFSDARFRWKWFSIILQCITQKESLFME
jgi:hypothetical protein